MNAIAHSELTGRLVLNRQTTEKLGTVEQFWLDPHVHRVCGLICQAGLLNRQRQFIAWERLESIGQDSILVNSTGGIADPDPPPKSALIVGHELWTDRGDRAGKIVDFCFEPETAAVSVYLFATSGWRGVLEGLYSLPPVAISSVGDKRAIALAATIQQAEKYQPGTNLSRRLAEAKDFLQDDFEQTKAHLGSAWQETQAAATKLRDRASDSTETSSEEQQQ
ncbi:MAG: photosystem reaction center subunit H [Spirulinaceae cyanobacterium SM2_1_0]|nr:photosystem reaction center subunit H [Spirulinaceae cyanobacterium SM2_1_0]